MGYNGISTTVQTKNSDQSAAQQIGATIPQRSLAKQFESMDLISNHCQEQSQKKQSGFVVNTLTTANQRASSKSSAGSINGGTINFV